MNKRVIIVFVILTLGSAGFYFINTNPFLNKAKYAAVVGSEGITREHLQKEAQKAKIFFEWTKQDASKLSSLERDALERMINEGLVLQYAKSHEITVSDAEVERRYLQVVEVYNRHNKIKNGDSQFLSQIKKMYGTEKSDYLKQVKMDILKENVQAQVGMPLVKWLEEEKKTKNIERFD